MYKLHTHKKLEGTNAVAQQQETGKSSNTPHFQQTMALWAQQSIAFDAMEMPGLSHLPSSNTSSYLWLTYIKTYLNSRCLNNELKISHTPFFFLKPVTRNELVICRYLVNNLWKQMSLYRFFKRFSLTVCNPGCSKTTQVHYKNKIWIVSFFVLIAGTS